MTIGGDLIGGGSIGGGSIGGGSIGGAVDPASNPFITSVKSDNVGISLDDEFQIPLSNSGGVLDFTVTSPGLASPVTITAFDDAAALLQFTSAGTHVLTFTPNNGTTINGWRYANAADRLKQLEVSQVGDFEIDTDMGFYGCTNLTWTADITDTPTITSTTLNSYFRNCSNFNGDIDNWDVSAVTIMLSMFENALAFNQSIDSWVVSAVTTMELMFEGATAFNQSINSWNVSAVTKLRDMFRFATAYNQSMNSWNVSFVTDMHGMFQGATAFAGNITSWVTSACLDMSMMFNNADAFNQDIGSWNTSLVTTLNGTFQNNNGFNQDISSWDVSSVTDMFAMFNGATTFNQDISSWDVSSVTNIGFMLKGATPFEQDLGIWDIIALTGAAQFLANVTLTTTNYGGLLVGWEANTHNSSVVFSGGSSTYSEGAVDSGTTDATTANKLIESGQNFITTVTIGDVIHNTTDDTFALVTAIDSDTSLSLSADIMISGETYVVQGSAVAKARARLILDDSWTITDGGEVA